MEERVEELQTALSEFKSDNFERLEETYYKCAESFITAEKIQTSTDEFHLYHSIEALPKNVCLRKSSVSENECGIWSNTEIPKGVRFGPYEGIIFYDRDDVNENGYFVKELEEEQTDCFVDSDEENQENWLDYVNFASHQTQQNLVILKCGGNIYYQTTKDVLPDTELLAWYETKSPIEIQSGDTVSGANVTDKNDFCEKESVNEKQNPFMHIAEKLYGCDICGKKLTRKTNVKVHHRIHTGEKPYVCDLCGIGFTFLKGLRTHQSIHTGEKPFVCSVCDKSFSRKHNLKSHQRIHTGEKPYTCNICGKQFTQNHSLKEHKYIHGEKQVDAEYICDVCGTGFTDYSSLNKHWGVHTGEKPYICNMCGKKFTYDKILKRHLRIHTEEKFFVCEVCGEKFILNSSLKKHQFIHTGEKPHICDICGMRFPQMCYLKSHQRIHTAEKHYVCDVCGSKFTDVIFLKNHQHIHQYM